MSRSTRLAALEKREGKAAELCIFLQDAEGGLWKTDALGVFRRYTEAEAAALCRRPLAPGEPLYIVLDR